MTTTKLILSSYEQSVCRVHFLLVGEVISFLFVLMGSIIAATKWYHYSLLAFALLVSLFTFYSAWTLHIRLLIGSAVLLFLKVAFKLVALVILSHKRLTIYDECYLTVSCHYEDWQLQLINLANGIAFLFPSTIISFVNMVSLMYLVYLFRNNRHQQ